jgi:hypothetical protein
VTGRRIYPNAEGHLPLAEGDYGFNPAAGCWECRPPGRHAGSLRAHTVTEHEDGTITVSPSILFVGMEDAEPGSEFSGWHGFLERGVWRSV